MFITATNHTKVPASFEEGFFIFLFFYYMYFLFGFSVSSSASPTQSSYCVQLSLEEPCHYKYKVCPKTSNPQNTNKRKLLIGGNHKTPKEPLVPQPVENDPTASPRSQPHPKRVTRQPHELPPLFRRGGSLGTVTSILSPPVRLKTLPCCNCTFTFPFGVLYSNPTEEIHLEFILFGGRK